MQSAIETNDNILDIFQTETKTTNLFEEGQRVYYFARDVQNSSSREERTYIDIFLRSHNEQRVYKRETYDMLTYISDLGGGFEVLVQILGTLSGLVTVSLVQAAFIKAAYRIQETTTGEGH